MKKIGIITFHRSHNNGSMLQALALQNILEKKYVCDVKIIDFSNSAQQNMYAKIPKPTNFKRLIKSLIWLTNYRQMKKQYDSYEKFINNYFNLTARKYSELSELDGLEEKFDAIITGSDQVWNIKCIDADDAYYLPFVKDKPKYTYAVSFGANNPFELDDKYRELVEDFNLISVREKNAQKWVRESINIEPKICLDPTMLLSREEWEKIASISETPIVKGDYIFYYCFSITEPIQRFLKFISNKYNMPVYFMEAKEWTLKTCWRNSIKLIKSYGPDVYLNVVKNAKLFITTSFHGTAFATIYGKNFWYINSGENNLSKDDRAVSFLTQLDLMSRYKTIDDLKNIDLFLSIDYENTKNKLSALQNESFDYLESILRDIDNEQ